ncbi:MAG: hypothetical protein LBR60_08120 [Fibrobacter sp.]|jgi:site-specific DNA-methyltransferase (adenine-specific)|nr:hypothetical protein [Fibrobacter sp.]
MNKPSSRNRTVVLSDSERSIFENKLRERFADPQENAVIWGDALEVLKQLPDHSVDLVVTDPPYNMTKLYNGRKFAKTNAVEYETWLRSWVELLPRVLKETASVYVCTEWQSSGSVERVLREFFIVRNRITWEREKGRGAKENWKNASEDIWFCTVSDQFTFNLDAVRLKRKVIAPYRDKTGTPKDWNETEGEKFRETSPSNLWTDITVPFWSMSENTNHPTQKPEKLIAKLILASSNEHDLVLDPFAGSGTTPVTAFKLGRRFWGIEREKEYAMLALKRLNSAESDKSIQGFQDGVFWERNSGK